MVHELVSERREVRVGLVDGKRRQSVDGAQVRLANGVNAAERGRLEGSVERALLVLHEAQLLLKLVDAPPMHVSRDDEAEGTRASNA